MAWQVDIAEDVHVVDEDGFRIVEKGQGLHDAASGVHQLSAFVGDIDFSLETMRVEKADDLVAEVMDVDDDGAEAAFDKGLDIALQKRLTGHFDEGFGLVGRQFLEPCAQAGGKNHGGSIHGCAVRCGWSSR